MKVTKGIKRILLSVCLSVSTAAALCAMPAHEEGDGVAAMRRPVDNAHPMWLVHIDCWNYADPQKIIDLMPEDVRPWCVFNLSLSASHSTSTGEFTVSPNGIELVRSWGRVCAENRVWFTVQPSSGGYNHFPDNGDYTEYERFYKEFPNFIGFNFAEQFWGYEAELGPSAKSASFSQRMTTFAGLMKLAHKYGGYLITSWCGVFWGASLNPISYQRNYAAFANECKACPEHFILCEKYTTSYGYLDIESTCLGTWLSGFAGHYGQRFDQCCWDSQNDGSEYPYAAGCAPMLSHQMLTGQDVFDGPELIWKHCFKEVSQSNTADGFTHRNWARFLQFDNIPLDIYRKIVDGTLRILSRKEVIDRTKIIVLNNLTVGNDRQKYLTHPTLFQGLYQMETSNSTDTAWFANKSWTKSTGRYPAIPTTYQLYDSLAQTFQVQVKRTAYATRWSSLTAKRNEFNKLFPKQYTGTAFADHVDNVWCIYNPYINKTTLAYADIPLQYNTATSVRLVLNQYSTVQMREESDALHLYLNNYEPTRSTLLTDTIAISGVASPASLSYSDRGTSQSASQVKGTWNAADSSYTVVISHNGPLDLTVNCQGLNTDRAAVESQPVALTAPAAPPVYLDTLQTEAEVMDYKNVAAYISNGVGRGISDYVGQGYVNFGKIAGAYLRDTIDVPAAGKYYMLVRYMAPDSKVNNVYAGYGLSKKALSLKQSKTWAIAQVTFPSLKAGRQCFSIQSPGGATNNLYIDCIMLVPDSSTVATGLPEVLDKMPSAGDVTTYFDLSGRVVASPKKGEIYVRRTASNNGKFKISKVIF